MLYNPRWEKTADIFSLLALISWLEKQNPRERYNFWDYSGGSGGCLYAQYMAYQGIPWRQSGAHEIGTPRGKFVDFVFAKVASAKPHTFGAALSRAQTTERWRKFWQFYPLCFFGNRIREHA